MEILFAEWYVGRGKDWNGKPDPKGNVQQKKRKFWIE
jgi:hypothetical protein